jgi:hypothetical protein
MIQIKIVLCFYFIFNLKNLTFFNTKIIPFKPKFVLKNKQNCFKY